MPPTTCRDAPIAPDPAASDNAWSAYKKARDDAGDDCREKLQAVHRAIDAWPK